MTLKEQVEEFSNNEWWLDFEINIEKKILVISNAYKGQILLHYDDLRYVERK